MKNTFLLAVDGSPGSENATAFAASRAKMGDAKIIVAYVIEWSPYSFNTPEENDMRHKRREEELDSARSLVHPTAESLKKEGITVETIVRHGHTANVSIDLAERNDVAQIFVGRSGSDGIKARFFGSVASRLAQASPVPVTVVP